MSQGSGASRQVKVISDALRRRFEDHIDLSDVTNPDPEERRRCLLTRALAAAIVASRSGCDDVRAASLVTDGGQDFGIDAVAFGAGASRLWLIQTKWSDKAEARFGENDVMSMADGLRRIDHRQFDRFNDKLRTYTNQISTVLDDARASITLTIGVMRHAPLHDNVLLRLRELRDEYNAHGHYLDFEIVAITDIWEMIRRTAQPEPIGLNFDLQSWYPVVTPMQAYAGLTTAAAVASWYEMHGDQLFRRNIRESLGVTQVNADITQSLIDEPHEFWYRNNGVTILCDHLDMTPKSKSAPHGIATIEAKNASVVNGAQTVAAIAEAVRRDAERVGSAIVGIRIIKSADEATSAEITKATNTQNHIERRDFVALDEIQLAIKEEFSLTLDLTYAIRRSEFEPSPESGCTVREAAIALTCAHPDPRLVQRVRTNEDLLWEEGAQGTYSRIFGEPPPAIQIWRSVLLLRRVRDSLHAERSQWEGRAAAVAEQGSLVIANIVFQEVGRDGIDDPDYDWKVELERVPDLVSQAVRRLVAEIDGQFGLNSFIQPTLSSADRVLSLVRATRRAFEAGEAVPELRPDYIPAPRQRAPRRRNSVHILVDAGRIKDGSSLQFHVGTEAERQALAGWLAEDGRRSVATWVNDRARPLVWSADGKRYTPTGLANRIWALAEWSGAPIAVQGPGRWHLGREGSLAALAEEIQRTLDAPNQLDGTGG